MSKRTTIKITNLSIGYKTGKQIKFVSGNINSSLSEGELTCLLGANGVGKSTLLRTLSAFQSQLSGDIYIKDKKIEDYSYHELSMVIGVVLTEKNDLANLTVRELVGMGRSPYTGFWGNLSRDDNEKVDEAIALVKIEDLADRMIQTLSDGERQKVMIAKALAQETPVVYLDEPTAFLDYPSKVEIMQLLHQLTRKTRKTIFLSTHDLELALQIADKVWLMDKVKGITVGTPEDLSLNGNLGSFFCREEVVFDPESGLFRMNHTYSAQVRLIGDESKKYAMVQKALRRNGILSGREIDSDIFIDTCGQNETRLVIGSDMGRTTTVRSIEDLLEKITAMELPIDSRKQVSG